MTAQCSEPRLSALRDTVLPTYARADVTIVRGDGCRVWDDAGPRVPRFRRRHRRRRSRPSARRRRSRQRTSSSTASGTRRTSTGRSRCSGSPRLLAERFPGGSLLLQLGRRGERGRAQDRAQGDRPHPDRGARGRLSRPYARGAVGDRPAREVGGIRAARPGYLVRAARTTSSPSRPRSPRPATPRSSCSSPSSARAA